MPGFVCPTLPSCALRPVLKHRHVRPLQTRTLSNQHPFGAPKSGVSVSVPRSHAVHPTDTMPAGTVDDIKRLIDTLIPEFSGRELIDQVRRRRSFTHQDLWLTLCLGACDDTEDVLVHGHG